MLKGIDISYAQEPGSIDFSPYDFVIIRSSYGNSDKDENMEAHAQNAIAAGKLIGFYHYAYPNYNNSGVIEANCMLKAVEKYIGQAILVLDWEEDVSQPVSWCEEFLETIKNNTGTTPFFYTFASAASQDKYLPLAAKYPLWLAHWDTQNPDSGVWDKWTIWQYSEGGGQLDQDYFDGTRQDWLDWCGEFQGEWISFNGYTTQGQMEDNAELAWKYFRSKGWSLQAVCGMLGNMQAESGINPGIWGYLEPWGDPTDKGYGLVQWTPYTRITDWQTAHGYDIGDGNGQCEKLQEELDHPEIENTWHTSGTPYSMTFKEYSVSVAAPGELAQVFLACYERPANPNQPQRSEYAENWYRYLKGGPTFVPRLTSEGMEGNPYWYANNPFYQAGYGLPNCTCYVWGRWWEITGQRPSKLSLGDANDFYPESTANGVSGGTLPALGAIACYHYTPGGHVSVVEVINSDGSIVTSNSGWGSAYFWTETVYPPDYKPSWADYADFHFDGFLYLDTQPVNPNPPNPNPEPGTFIPPMGLMYYLKLF